MEAIDVSLGQSSRYLNQEKLNGVLLHRAEHLWCNDSIIFSRLKKHRDENRIHKIGVSIQNPSELISLENFIQEIDIIQMPLNILDHRFTSFYSTVEKFRKLETEIHIRSIFLQGLLLSAHESRWQTANVSDPKEVLSWIDKTMKVFDFDSPLELFLTWGLSLNFVDAIVIGAANSDEFQSVVQTYSQCKRSRQLVDYAKETIPFLDDSTLDPSKWKNYG